MVELTLHRGVARITLADPANANALGEAMVGRLREVFAAIDSARQAHVVVLTAEGDTFSSGAPRDLLMRLAAGEVRPADIVLPKLLLDCEVPVVAAMAGHATGGGFALGLAADIVVIAEESRYGFTFMNLGFTPGMGTTRLCEHTLSSSIAHELLYSGELRRGSRFAGTGINHVVPREQVNATALDIAERIADKPRTAITALKRTLSLRRRQAFEESITQESLMHQLTLAAAARRIENEYVE
ncbi:MAG TPA: polyketide synthase [Vicinamibacterales bacterium]